MIFFDSPSNFNNMYTDRFTVPTSDVITATILTKLETIATKREFERIAADTDGVLTRFVGEVLRLCAAIKAGDEKRAKTVFLVCEKAPRSLDAGRHYFSMYYVNDGGVQKFWPAGESIFAKLIYMQENNRDMQMPKWMFASGVIGMDRVLAATNGISRFLADCGAGSVQFTGQDCL